MLSRRGWVVVLTVLAVAGVVFRWQWLVALGLASIVLSVVPCLIMCAFGLCAYRMLGRSRCEKPLQGAGHRYGPERPFRRRARRLGKQHGATIGASRMLARQTDPVR